MFGCPLTLGHAVYLLVCFICRILQCSSSCKETSLKPESALAAPRGRSLHYIPEYETADRVNNISYNRSFFCLFSF